MVAILIKPQKHDIFMRTAIFMRIATMIVVLTPNCEDCDHRVRTAIMVAILKKIQMHDIFVRTAICEDCDHEHNLIKTKR